MLEIDPTTVEQLFGIGRGCLNLTHKVELLATLRAQGADNARRIDALVMERCTRLMEGLREAQGNQEKLKELLEQVTAPPWHPAVFVCAWTSPDGPRALVAHGNSRRVVAFDEDVDPATLATGEEVLLGHELNVIMGKSPYPPATFGETAFFERRLPDGRIVLRWREEELVVQVAAGLKDCELKAGDEIRWDRTCWMAFEKVERSRGTDLFLEDTPAESFDCVGGLDSQIRAIKQAIDLRRQNAAIAAKYRLRAKRGGFLLVGEPGNGKTLLARAVANYVSTLGRTRRCRFMNVKPGQFNSMWFGQSEANCREMFRVAAQAGQEDPDTPVIMFLDEIDAVGAARGESLARVGDRVLQSLMAELDGLTARGNLLVLAATNRQDALDPALLRPGRLGDHIIQVPRPNRSAGHDILAKYLPPDIPYVTDRDEIIDAALSVIFSPNGEGELATLVFRDGTRRGIRQSDLVSGAVLANIATQAVERACAREVETGREGLHAHDVLDTITEQFDATARGLTPANCRRYFAWLPQDLDVVAVQPVVRRVPQPHKYLTLNVA